MFQMPVHVGDSSKAVQHTGGVLQCRIMLVCNANIGKRIVIKPLIGEQLRHLTMYFAFEHEIFFGMTVPEQGQRLFIIIQGSRGIAQVG